MLVLTYWWDRLWLLVNLTWVDLEDHDGRVYAKASDLYITIPLAFFFLIVRRLFEIFHTMLCASVSPSVKWEGYGDLSWGDVELLSKKSGCTAQQLERWFRRRRNQDRPSLLKKFREASWRFTFYLVAFIAGVAVIVDKPWFYDLKEVWKGYPMSESSRSRYWYYMIELSFYWSLLFSISSDVTRKVGCMQPHHSDGMILAAQMCIPSHNYIRAGMLIMALHDSSDYLLKNTCNNIFIVFTAVFIITRLIILPFWKPNCCGSCMDAVGSEHWSIEKVSLFGQGPTAEGSTGNGGQGCHARSQFYKGTIPS
uniref:TLC domain-containing protein n=1 Tax=Pelusios castaneus TaxID=367368 RepID=A0A8C8STT6_9SAUR